MVLDELVPQQLDDAMTACDPSPQVLRDTIDLLDSALALTGMSERQLSVALDMTPAALAVSRNHGKLSPIVACCLADLLNADPPHWCARSVMDSAQAFPQLEPLRRHLQDRCAHPRGAPSASGG